MPELTYELCESMMESDQNVRFPVGRPGFNSLPSHTEDLIFYVQFYTYTFGTRDIANHEVELLYNLIKMFWHQKIVTVRIAPKLFVLVRNLDCACEVPEKFASTPP